ncbi:MAG: hypothetical protein KAR05_03395 [Candidatus Omnitrophica bacterium]|nr:hypothetical protein [Candidatus Omnitrophota bacterium]
MRIFLFRRKKEQRCRNKAQVALELCFSLFGTVLIILGTIRLFVWSGKDLIGRLAAHRDGLIEDVPASYDGILYQLRPRFYKGGTAPFQPSVRSEIFQKDRPYD